MSAALYVYCIIPDLGRADWGPIGIDGARVYAVVRNGLAALVHEAQATPYQGRNEEVERWVLAHSGVIERAWEAAGTVLPMTFNVLVKSDAAESGETRLGHWLESGRAGLAYRLESLRDLVELRVEIDLGLRDSVNADLEVAALRAELTAKPAGLRRLLEKKLDQAERQAADRIADRLYCDYRRRLASIAEELVETKRHRPPAGHVPVFSGALLVSKGATHIVGTELAKIQAEQPAVRVRFLGPWPPYSFADADPVSGNPASASEKPAEHA